LKKESTIEVIAPSIVFALVLHLVFQKIFMADLSTPWLLLVLGIQAVMFTAWAFEKLPGSFTITGAALAALVVDLFVVVRSVAGTHAYTSLPFMGAALSSLLIIAALYASYQLATSAGYWFTHQTGSATSPVNTSARQGPGLLTSITDTESRGTAKPSPSTGTIDKKISSQGDAAPVFRIHHAITGDFIISLPVDQLGQNLQIVSLKKMLTDYEPDSVKVVQITWSSDAVIDVFVEGEIRGSGKEHYTLLEFED
jgi:hypothetical protein